MEHREFARTQLALKKKKSILIVLWSLQSFIIWTYSLSRVTVYSDLQCKGACRAKCFASSAVKPLPGMGTTVSVEHKYFLQSCGIFTTVVKLLLGEASFACRAKSFATLAVTSFCLRYCMQSLYVSHILFRPTVAVGQQPINQADRTAKQISDQVPIQRAVYLANLPKNLSTYLAQQFAQPFYRISNNLLGVLSKSFANLPRLIAQQLLAIC